MPMPAEHCRLFLALWPDASARALLANHAQAWSWPEGCARYAPADWHVTLHFLGAVPRALLGDLAERLSVPFTPFTLTLDRPQRWPHGLAVIGASEVPRALQALHTRLGEVLQALGVPLDARPYAPHLTLARRANQAAPPAASVPIAWPVQGYALVESTGKRAARYRIVRSYGASDAAAAQGAR